MRRSFGCVIAALLASASLAPDAQTPPSTPQLNQNCVVNVLNRTVQVSPQGGWSMPNVPSNMGRVRARATCTEDGQTVSGQTDYFNVVQNGVTSAGPIHFENQEPVPVSLAYTVPGSTTLTAIGATVQLGLRATYPDGSTQDVTPSAKGANYSSTNNAIATVSPEGLVIARSSGIAFITGRKDEVVAIKQIVVSAAGDADGDGMPDDYEQANGLNPNDAIDAQEDHDGDGLTARREFQLGTNLRNPDSDADGLSDGEEVEAGTDGFITNPLDADTDGDGLRDRVEVLAGSSPTDPNDRNLAGALDRITVNPPTVVLTFNTINTEVSTQLAVTGILIDGSTINLTPKSTGTTYTSSNLSIVSFGLTDGEIFAGQSGDATVTVANNGKTFVVSVRVETFQPVALSAIDIPGYANNVDVSGDYAFVAAGNSGLQVVDVSDRRAPAVVGSLDTDGTAIDIRVLGNFAYIADGSAGLTIVDVSNPLAPVLAGSIDTAGVAQDLKVDGQYAYVADGTAGVLIFDVSDPARPVLKGAVDGLGEVKGIDVEGDRAVAIGGTSLYVLNVSNRSAPAAVGAVNIGQVKDVVVNGDYAYIAAYSTGYRVVNISDSAAPVITGGDASIAPRDVELTDGFAFFAEQLFPNVVAFVNVQDPEDPVFQGVIDLSPFGDYAGTGISLDGSYAYITEESFVVGQDFGTTGTTRLFIAQYRLIADNGGVPPVVAITRPTPTDPAVEGTTLIVNVTATDDIGVRAVNIAVDGVQLTTDTTRPYQVPISIPFGKTSITIAATAVDFGQNTASAQVTVPVLKDTDRDGLGDITETSVYGTDPNDADSDNDDLEDGEEITLGTNPLNADSDGDGRSDSQEVAAETDPLNPDITPPVVAAIDPANDATGIAENQPVTVTFNEPLLAKSIRSDSLRLLLNGNPVAGTVRLMPNGVDLVFTPNGLLTDFTTYDVSVAGVRDVAGNLLAATFTSSYTTGNVIDTTPPTIAASNPAQSAQGVATNAIVRILMSEPIDPLTVTAQTFYVTDSQGTIPGTGTLSEDGRTLTFVPNAALAVSRFHTVQLWGIRDLFGNQTFLTLSFTTAFVADATAPVIVSTSLFDGQSAVPTNGTISVRFNEAINRLALDGIQLRRGAATVATTRTVTADAGGTWVDLVPAQPLLASTAYIFSIQGIEDLSGNVLAVGRTVSFTTGTASDTTVPQLVLRTPLSSADNVPLNTVIEGQYNERINPVSLHPEAVRLYDNSTGQFLNGTIGLVNDGTVVRFTPGAPLTPNRTYTYYLGYATFIEDIAGNRTNTSTSFSTGTAADTTAPQVLMQSIADGATGIAVNGQIVLYFDTPLADRCVNSSTVQFTSGDTPITGAITLSTDRRTLTFKSTAALAANTAYTLRLQGVCDLAGNTLPTFVSGFTTSAVATPDTTRPTVTIIPAQGATNVPVNTAIVMTFSEPIDVTTLAGGIQVSVSGFSGELAGNLSVNGTVVTFTPIDPLPGSKTISVTVSGVDDLANNVVIGQTRSFSTGPAGDVTAPRVLSITPNDGALDMARNTPIVLTFSESLDASTLDNQSFALFVNGDSIRPSVQRSSDNRTVVLTASLPAAAVVSVIATSGVLDLSGNALPDFVSAFTTSSDVDNDRPRVVTQFPGSGSSEVLRDAPVTLYVDESLDTGTIESALHVSQNGTLVQGVVTVGASGQAITFRPNQPWAFGAYIEVFLDSTARDLQGNALTNYAANFRVVADQTAARPTVTAFAPLFPGNVGALPINAVIDTQFNEPLDPASIAAAAVFLRDNTNFQSVPVTVSLIKGGTVVRARPISPLLPSHSYSLFTQANQIRDLQGQSPSFNNGFSFNTSATADGQGPRLLAVSPPSGSTNLGVNTHVHARFDEPVNSFSLSGLNEGPASNYGSVFWSEGNRDVRFARHVPYAASTEITESLATVEDYAGNAVQAPASTTFTTGSGADTTDPLVSEVIPGNLSNIPVNAVIRVRFNEPLDPVSITSDAVYLYDSQIGQLPGTVSLEADGRTIVIVPNQALNVGRSHSINLTPVRDLAGNERFDFRSFTTSFVADVAGPQVVATSVQNGATGIPTNAQISVRFNEPLSELDLAGIQLRLGGVPVAAVLEKSTDRTVFYVRTVEPLEANLVYDFAIAGVKDLSGNAIAAPVNISFTTGAGADLITQALASRIPSNGATGVPTNTVIQATYNERMNPVIINTDTVRLYTNDTGEFVAGTVSILNNGTAVRFTPSAPLKPHTSYHYYQGYSAALEDLAGHTSSLGWSFETGAGSDATAPALVLQSIADGAANVAVNGRMLMQFDAPLAETCVNGQTIQLTNGGVPVSGTITLSSNRMLVTFVASQPLATNTAYSMRLQGVCDLAGNVLPTFTTGFTTSASATPDTTRPAATTTPANGSTNVSVNTTINVTFNEPIDVTTIAGGIQVSVSGFSGEVAGNISMAGNVATFTPLNPLPANKQIFVSVSGVTDLSGNNNTGGSVNFTTGAGGDVSAPQVLSITPADGTVGVARGMPITLTFSESLDASTLGSFGFTLFVNGVRQNPSISRSQDNRTVVLTSSLPASSVVAVIATSEIKDLSGNALTDFASVFTTGPAHDGTRPQIVTQFPGSGSNGVGRTANLVLYANEPLDVSSLQQGLHVSQNGQIVNGTITTAGGGQIVTFTPSQPWAFGSLIEVFVRDDVADPQGNALFNYQGSFRVQADPAASAPTVASFPNNLGALPISTVVDILMSEAMDPATVTTATVTLRDNNTNLVVPTTVSLIKQGLVIRVRPQAPLVVSRSHSVTLTTGLRDLQGQPLQFNNGFGFSTSAVAVSDTQPPLITSLSPPNGATGVALNGHLHARFDEPINAPSLIPDAGPLRQASVFWSNTNRDFRLLPHAPYSPNVEMTESLELAQDFSANAVAPPFSTTFTTGAAPDVTDPSAIDFVPFHTATNVAVNAVARVRFNEQIDPASITSDTFYVSGPQGQLPGTGTLEPDGRTLTFVPTQPYAQGTSFSIIVSNIYDLAGNARFTSSSFQTGVASDAQTPLVLGTSIADGATAVPTNAVIQVQFTEPVSGLTLDGIVLRLAGQPVPASYTMSGDRRTVTLKLVQPLAPNASYSLSVSGVADLSGNVLGTPRTFGFTTGTGVDLRTPTLGVHVPATNETGVARNIQIEAQISERMNPLTVNTDSVRLYNNSTGQFFTVTVTLTPDGQTIRIVPQAILSPNTSYHVYLPYTGQLDDLAGNNLSSGWNFTTGAL